MEDLSFNKFWRDENLNLRCFTKIKPRNIQLIPHVRICHAYCYGYNAGWKKMQFRLVLNRTFAPPHHHSSTDDASTTKEQKLTKQCSLLPPHRFLLQSSQCQYWKANTYSIITGIEIGPPVSESSTGSQNFIPSTDSEHKFHKMEIENWLRIGFNLALITTTLCSSTNGESHKVLYTHS